MPTASSVRVGCVGVVQERVRNGCGSCPGSVVRCGGACGGGWCSFGGAPLVCTAGRADERVRHDSLESAHIGVLPAPSPVPSSGLVHGAKPLMGEAAGLVIRCVARSVHRCAIRDVDTGTPHGRMRHHGCGSRADSPLPMESSCATRRRSPSRRRRQSGNGYADHGDSHETLTYALPGRSYAAHTVTGAARSAALVFVSMNAPRPGPTTHR